MSEELNALLDDDAQEQTVDAQEPTGGAGVAEPEGDQEPTEPEGDKGEPAPQPPEENHKFAEFRKTTQAEIKRLADEAARKDQLAAMIFETTVKGEMNPYTNKPIETIEDFIAWKQEDERKARESAGITDERLQQMLANLPEVKKAAEIIERDSVNQTTRAIESEIAKIQAMVPKSNIKSLQDLVTETKDNKVFNALVKGGMTLSEAYAEVHKIPQKKQDDTKDHLKSVGGGNAGGSETEIPANELSTWKEMFPDETHAQIRARYNRALTRQQ